MQTINSLCICIICVETFESPCTFQTLKRHIDDLQNNDRTDLQSLQKLFLNIIKAADEQFFTIFSKFRELEETAKFMRFPNSIKMEELNLQKFSWIEIDKFEMRLIEFYCSSIWKQKFVDLRVDWENIEKRQLEKKILERSAGNKLLRAWNAIFEKFFLLKKLCNNIAHHVFIYICL